MPLTLQVDAARWRTHLDDYVASLPDGVELVPVTKGNGYGFGNQVLAAEASRLGAATLAVGTYREIDDVRRDFAGDILVLTPWRPADPRAVATTGAENSRVVHTVSRAQDLPALEAASPRPRAVIEVLTSMNRHGIEPDTLRDPAPAAAGDGWSAEGIALHLPLAGGSHVDEAVGLGRAAMAAESVHAGHALWVSHLTPAEAGTVAQAVGVPVKLRVATALWLGDRGALAAKARVLDVHRVRRGTRIGYRQRRVRRDGYVVVVGGGTAHGIGLEAPSAASSLRQRGVAMASGVLEAGGWALSPFTIAGKRRWFAEPPHMQCSLVLVPGDVEPPQVGDELDVDVRFTTTTFDDTRWQ